MHYYQFNIGDYRRKAYHLTLLEHGVYRQLLDQYYMDENPFPNDIPVICRFISARSKAEKNAVQQIISEFFILRDNLFFHDRCKKELDLIYGKSEKARLAAEARWSKRNANAMQTHAPSNAKPMLPKDTKTLIPKDTNTNKAKRFIKPTVEEVKSYCDERGNQINPKHFVDHYDGIGWMRGKNKIKNWKAVVRTWESNKNGKQGFSTNGTVSASDRKQAAYEEELARIQAEDSSGMGAAIELEASQFSSRES